jgi:hypothetical protein
VAGRGKVASSFAVACIECERSHADTSRNRLGKATDLAHSLAQARVDELEQLPNLERFLDAGGLHPIDDSCARLSCARRYYDGTLYMLALLHVGGAFKLYY